MAPLQQADPREQEREELQNRVEKYLLFINTNKSEVIFKCKTFSPKLNLQYNYECGPDDEIGCHFKVVTGV